MKCRLCSEDTAYKLGRVPDCKEFAGQSLKSPVSGDLWACRNCGSMFKYPILPAKDYISLYETAAGALWDTSKIHRNDIARIYSYLSTRQVKSILDVGCFSGEFLNGISDNVEKYGIEPSVSAARIAQSLGVKIVAKTLDSLQPGKQFDVVVAIDVIEHIEDIRQFMEQAFSFVQSNGVLIISTGDPECYWWKYLYKSMFWYSSYPEHITFPGYDFFSAFAKKNKLKKPIKIQFKYEDVSVAQKCIRLIGQLAYFISPKVYGVLKKWMSFLLRGIDRDYDGLALGAAGVFKDHQVIIIQNELENHLRIK